MNGIITWEQVFALIALMGAIGAVWARLESSRTKIADDLASFKLEVTRNYVRNDSLLEMEKRVLGHIENLSENVSAMRKDVMQAITSRRRT